MYFVTIQICYPSAIDCHIERTAFFVRLSRKITFR